MKFLFLDLEITGFDLSFDQILELGAAVAILKNNKLEIESTFSKLIKPTIAIPEHIPRLTGLSESDFVNQDSQETIKKLWQNWIEQNELRDHEIIIIGHSVKVDIGFLKTNRFWLPTTPKTNEIPFLDTLDLAKVLLPDQSNLSLEFLSKNLKLTESILKDFTKADNNTDNSQKNTLKSEDLIPHRALFDTLIGIEFFNYCLKRIDNLQIPLEILDFLFEANLLPTKLKSLVKIPESFIQITKTPETNPEIITEIQPPQNIQIIDFSGKVIPPSINQNLDQLFSIPKIPKHIISQIQNPKLPKKYKQTLTQIYIYFATKHLFPNFELRLHSYGLQEKVAIEGMIEYLKILLGIDFEEKPIKSDEISTNSTSEFELPVFERILSNIDQLVELEFEFGKFSYELDFLAECYALEFGKELIPKVSVDMDFLAARMENILQQHPKKELLVNRPGQNMDLDINDVYNLFQNICEKFKELQNTILEIPNSSSLVSFLAEKVSHELQKFEANNWAKNIFTIKLSKNNLKLTKPKSSFSWDSYWYKLSQIPNLTLTTYLDQNGWDLLGTLVGLPDDLATLPNDFVKSLRSENVKIDQNDQNTEELLKKIQEEQQKNSVTLVLCGQNSGLERVIQLAITNFSPDQFLAIGETGSLTKISGKIKTGFSGIVIIKSTDLFMLSNIENLKLNPTALLIQPPYLNLNQFWFSKTHDPKELINTSKRILRNSITGTLSQMGVETIKYQPEIVR